MYTEGLHELICKTGPAGYEINRQSQNRLCLFCVFIKMTKL